MRRIVSFAVFISAICMSGWTISGWEWLGDPVLMAYARGIITLKLNCKAREPGAVGDEIRLYAPNTDTTYRARLTAPGQAEWIETL